MQVHPWADHGNNVIGQCLIGRIQVLMCCVGDTGDVHYAGGRLRASRGPVLGGGDAA